MYHFQQCICKESEVSDEKSAASWPGHPSEVMVKSNFIAKSSEVCQCKQKISQVALILCIVKREYVWSSSEYNLLILHFHQCPHLIYAIFCISADTV